MSSIVWPIFSRYFVDTGAIVMQNRRTFLKTALGGTAALVAGCSATSSDDDGEALMLYVGTYSRGGSRGIYRVSMNVANGRLRIENSFPGLQNPAFLAIDPTNRYLFAVSETGEYEGARVGSVASHAIDAATGNLVRISQQPSGGAAPVHVSVAADASFILVANYNGGNVAMLPVDDAGALAPPSSIRQHTGSSVNPQRQERPHAHSIYLDKDERFALAVDLGTDEIRVYRIDRDSNALVPTNPPAYATQPGAGPRHLVFHPNGRRVFVINELSNSITSFDYDTQTGALSPIATVSTLPAGFSGFNTCAEIRMSASGRFVYGSNRGHDSIAVFALDDATGTLTPVQHVSTGGRTPRNFEIDPTGRYLIAANQDSNNLVVFSIDSETGMLEATGETLTIPAPVCVRFRHPGA